MRKTSIRIRLMVLMICLTTLPVLTVTRIATNNTRSSVEKEMISANTSRPLWADQYLDELIRQIDILFYTLRINETLMAELNDIDSPDIGVQYKTQNFIRDTLISAFHANSRKIDELSPYVRANQKALTVNFANSGLMPRLDLRAGPWSRMLQPPVNMYFKRTGSGISAFHSMNRFEDHALIGGLSARINKDVWKEVERILMSEEGSSFYLLNDEKELLSGSAVEAASDGDVREAIANLKLEYSDLEFRKPDKHFAPVPGQAGRVGRAALHGRRRREQRRLVRRRVPAVRGP